jgi:hypothetical protein
MKKLTAPFVLFLILSHFGYSQNATIKGTVIDTAEKTNLYQTVITVLRKDDSTLVKFTRADKDGKFIIKNIPPGKFIVITSFPTYADFADEYTLNGDTTIDLGIVSMIPKAKLLEEVIVRQNVAIRIKGDTIEYKADSFKVSEGANVAEMLRKMPGMSVDRNGAITAQGQKVEKVLVDGEEFFSDDPAVVTQNLRADAIDKVQSFDKKSDQAEFTGVDDGVRSKTLNLVMKEDKKRGYFGKVSGGLGTNERTTDELMVNYFRGKKKLAAYGIYSNAGKVGLDWGDRDKFTGGSDFGDANVEVGAGFIMISGGGSDNDFSDWGGPSYYGEGIPRSFKGGAHFSNKWNSDINHINANYSLKKMDVDAEGNSLTKYILPDSAYYFRESHRSISAQTQQMFTGFYDIKLDSFSSIRFRLNGLIGNNRSDVHTDSESDDENLQRVNRNVRDNYTNSDNKIVMASVLWRQRLKKKGRTLSLSASHKYSDRESDGYLISDVSFYDPSTGNLLDRDSVDQLKEGYNKTLTSAARLVITEQIAAKTTLELNYSFNRNAFTSDRKSFDKVNGKYESLNQTFSNNYSMLFYSNTGGAKIQYTGKKLQANIGTNAGVSNYIQRDSLGKKVNQFKYTNLFPSSRISYRFSTQQSINFNYNGSPQPPSIDQIQPVLQNNDPLNIVVGNPDLKQAFNHNFNMFYQNFKVLSGRSIWANAGLNLMHNAIVQSQVIDSGKRTLKYVNTSGNFNWRGSLSYGFKIKKPETNISLDVFANGNRFVNFVNNLPNTTNNTRLGFGAGFNRYKENKFNYWFRASANKNFSKSSISRNASNEFWQYEIAGDFNVFLTKRLVIGSEANAYIRQKVDAFDANTNILIWNGNVVYKVFPKRNGEFKFEAMDMLNQRRGIERFFTANSVVEKNYQVLGQFFMLSFTWNFTRNPGMEAPKK